VSFNTILSMLPRCNAGRLRALAVTAATRSAVAPQVPTLVEAGVGGGEVSNWVGLVAPRGTPQAVVTPLSQAVAAVLREAHITGTLDAAGITPCGTTPAAFGEFIEADLRRWKPIASQFGAGS
jgi:tripartite-type tricarboxylate transporter receptor subunit TctC